MLVDDEPRARVIIRSFIDKVDGLEVTNETGSSVDAFNYLQDNTVDLLFLDIQMPELTGLELLSSLQNPPKVILISAHSEFALESYNFDVVDYLLKPVAFSRFLKAIDKVHKILDTEGGQDESESNSKAPEGYLSIKVDGIMRRIDYKDIRYLNSFGNYIKIFTPEGMTLITETMKNMETTLPKEHFLRVHKSYLVNLTRVRKATAKSLTVDEEEIPVGTLYRQELQHRLNT
jgi:DNA-binding LytR/AlgR family response regulator